MSVTLRHLLSPILRRWCTSSNTKSDDVTTNCDEQFECDEDDGVTQMETKICGKDEGQFSDIENARCSESEDEAAIVVVRKEKTSSEKKPLGKQMSLNNGKAKGPLTSTPSTSSAPIAKVFTRGNTSQETLSKDEARRRMLSWRKTTKLRKSSASETLTNGSKRAKESRNVRRIASSAVADQLDESKNLG